MQNLVSAYNSRATTAASLRIMSCKCYRLSPEDSAALLSGNCTMLCLSVLNLAALKPLGEVSNCHIVVRNCSAIGFLAGYKLSNAFFLTRHPLSRDGL